MEILELIFGLLEIIADCAGGKHTGEPADRRALGTTIIIIAGIFCIIFGLAVMMPGAETRKIGPDAATLIWIVSLFILMAGVINKMIARRKRTSRGC